MIHIFVILIMAHQLTKACPPPFQYLSGFKLFGSTIFQLGECSVRGATMVGSEAENCHNFTVITPPAVGEAES